MASQNFDLDRVKSTVLHGFADKISCLRELQPGTADRSLVKLTKARRVSADDVLNNFRFFWRAIDMRDDKLFLDITVMDQAMLDIDAMNMWRLSLQDNMLMRREWAQQQSSTLRCMWSYFLKLVQATEWSPNPEMLRLKQHYLDVPDHLMKVPSIKRSLSMETVAPMPPSPMPMMIESSALVVPSPPSLSDSSEESHDALPTHVESATNGDKRDAVPVEDLTADDSPRLKILAVPPNIDEILERADEHHRFNSEKHKAIILAERQARKRKLRQQQNDAMKRPAAAPCPATAPAARVEAGGARRRLRGKTSAASMDICDLEIVSSTFSDATIAEAQQRTMLAAAIGLCKDACGAERIIQPRRSLERGNYIWRLFVGTSKERQQLLMVSEKPFVRKLGCAEKAKRQTQIAVDVLVKMAEAGASVKDLYVVKASGVLGAQCGFAKATKRTKRSMRPF